ncbi:MAG: hypothetical protein ACRDWI_11385 [Jiangellaceae bacterium]
MSGRRRPSPEACRSARFDVGHPASLARGIATIYQELDLVDDLTVAENLFLGHELASGGIFIDRGRTRRRDIEHKRCGAHGCLRVR